MASCWRGSASSEVSWLGLRFWISFFFTSELSVDSAGSVDSAATGAIGTGAIGTGAIATGAIAAGACSTFFFSVGAWTDGAWTDGNSARFGPALGFRFCAIPWAISAID